MISYDEIKDKHDRGEDLNCLEAFILEYEPPGTKHAMDFRNGLEEHVINLMELN